MTTDHKRVVSHRADVTVHTVQGPTHCCYSHAAKLEGLMRFVGASTNRTAAPDDAQCSNCVNEAAQRLQETGK